MAIHSSLGSCPELVCRDLCIRPKCVLFLASLMSGSYSERMRAGKVPLKYSLGRAGFIRDWACLPTELASLTAAYLGSSWTEHRFACVGISSRAGNGSWMGALLYLPKLCEFCAFLRCSLLPFCRCVSGSHHPAAVFVVRRLRKTLVFAFLRQQPDLGFDLSFPRSEFVAVTDCMLRAGL